jgi:hypothetical protein
MAVIIKLLLGGITCDHWGVGLSLWGIGHFHGESSVIRYVKKVLHVGKRDAGGN